MFSVLWVENLALSNVPDSSRRSDKFVTGVAAKYANRQSMSWQFQHSGPYRGLLSNVPSTRIRSCTVESKHQLLLASQTILERWAHVHKLSRSGPLRSVYPTNSNFSTFLKKLGFGDLPTASLDRSIWGPECSYIPPASSFCSKVWPPLAHMPSLMMITPMWHRMLKGVVEIRGMAVVWLKSEVSAQPTGWSGPGRRLKEVD